MDIKPKNSSGPSVLSLNEFEDTIEVIGLKSCFLFLRCFGKYITCLKVGYRLNKDVAYDYINQYINTYCAENLVRFEFDRTPNSFNGKPFVNVEYVSVCYGVLKKEFKSFPKRFPNVRHLKFHQSTINRESCGVRFKHMDQLDINMGYDFSEFSINSATRLLNANQQLQNLVISVEVQRCDEIMITLLNIFKNNTNISKLTIRTGRINPLVKRFQIQRIIDEHHGLIELDLDCCKFTANDAFWLIHRLHSLQKFHFCIYDLAEYKKFESKVGKSGKWESSFDHESEMVTLNCKS